MYGEGGCCSAGAACVAIIYGPVPAFILNVCDE